MVDSYTLDDSNQFFYFRSEDFGDFSLGGELWKVEKLSLN